jgi:hypothetical protein
MMFQQKQLALLIQKWLKCGTAGVDMRNYLLEQVWIMQFGSTGVLEQMTGSFMILDLMG